MKHARRAVIFDLYGTLVDLKVDENTPVFWKALAGDFFGTESGVSGEALRGAFMRLVQGASSSIGEGFILNGVFTGMLDEFGIISTNDNIRIFAEKFRELSITCLRKKDYTDDMLGSIRDSGYKIGLISNTEALLTAYDLQVLDLDDKFDEIVFSSDVGIKKPNKRIFEIMLDRLGLEPEDCTLVGDTFNDDIAGALDAGIEAVFLTAFPSNLPACGNEDDDRITCAGFNLQEIIGALCRKGFAVAPAVE